MPPLSSITPDKLDTTDYKNPEWVARAVAEGKDPADFGSNNLAKKIITGFTSLAAAAALTFTPVDAGAQGTISAEAFKKCEADYIAEYGAKMEKAVQDGKPHLVAKFTELREKAIKTICPLNADVAANRSDTAATNERIAATNERIAANRSDTAATNERIAANKELEDLFARAKRVADKITAGSKDPADFRDLNSIYADLQKKQSAPGVAEVLPLLANLITKTEKLTKTGV